MNKIIASSLIHSENKSFELMPIVFVHLNDSIPEYLKTNIKRNIKFFPKNQIVLIMNQAAEKLEIKGLSVYIYEEDSRWSALESLLSHPKDFRKNFWLTSLARFLALEQFLDKYKKEILHVESDVLLAKDFPFSKLSMMVEPIAFPVVSLERGVASTVYIRNADICKKLNDFAILQANMDSQLSDMLLLRQFYNLFPKEVCILPSGPKNSINYKENIEIDLLNRFVKGIDYFNGVFDGNDLGVFIFGTNPINLRGKSILRSEINLNYAHIRKWQTNYSEKRRFIDMIASDQTVLPVYSIHATVKTKSIFSINEKNRIMKKRIKQASQPMKNVLHFKVLIKQLRISILKRLRYR